MFISKTALLNSIFILLFIIINLKYLAAQDYPYPSYPANTATVGTETPILQWKGSPAFSHYKVEVYDCAYIPGPNFNSVNLDDFSITYIKNGAVGYEASGLTVSEPRADSFVTVEDGGDQIMSFSNNFGTNNSVSVTSYPGDDYEGITYLHSDYFAMVEERDDLLIFMKFNFSGNGTVSSINQITTRGLSNPFITGQNDGYEGVTYNPISNKMYLIKEYNDMKIFEFTAPQAPNFSQTFNLTEPFNLEQKNWKPDDLAGIYHMSLSHKFSPTPAGKHLLLLSQESNAIYEIDLNGNLISQMDFDLGGYFGSQTNGFFQAEGITYKDGVIWIASEGDTGKSAKYYGFLNLAYQEPYAATSNLVYSKNNVSNTQLQVPACLLSSNREYCWKVTAYKSNGFAFESMYYNFDVQAQSPSCVCPSTINHSSSTSINNQSYYASNTIKSTYEVSGNMQLNYYAGNSITLNPGFEADQLCDFSAEIEACN